MDQIKDKWNLLMALNGVSVPSGNAKLAITFGLLHDSLFALRPQSIVQRNSDHMVNLIVCALVIVIVIFVGVLMRRPKS